MHTLPKLPYEYNALEPHIDEQTMRIHHTKHHQAYIDKLNTALEKYPELQNKTVNELLDNLETVPEEIRTLVKNNAGGHWNHTFFWEILGAKENEEIKKKISEDFGSFAEFQKQFKDTALARFGSGWIWLVIGKDGKLALESTANQDAPRGHAVLGLDVWEHAYYLKYQNKRADYVDAFWSVVNWEKVWYITQNS